MKRNWSRNIFCYHVSYWWYYMQMDCSNPSETPTSTLLSSSFKDQLSLAFYISPLFPRGVWKDETLMAPARTAGLISHLSLGLLYITLHYTKLRRVPQRDLATVFCCCEGKFCFFLLLNGEELYSLTFFSETKNPQISWRILLFLLISVWAGEPLSSLASMQGCCWAPCTASPSSIH